MSFCFAHGFTSLRRVQSTGCASGNFQVPFRIAERERCSNQVSNRIDLVFGSERALCVREGFAQREKCVAHLLLAHRVPVRHLRSARARPAA